MIDLINKLRVAGDLEKEELTELLRYRNQELMEYICNEACEVREMSGKSVVKVFGRIPVSSYCKYDCKYCGLRRGNRFATRYRMEEEQFLQYCEEGYTQGIRNFLLESGDDAFFSGERITSYLQSAKEQFPDAYFSLALGEKNTQDYKNWLEAGAESYFLRCGTVNEQQFKKIHSNNMSLLIRKQHLWNLKEAGYRVGTGFLVGMPYQLIDSVVEEIQFIKKFAPPIITMGAFVPSARTPFGSERSGNGEMTLYIMAILRLMLPDTEILAEETLECVLRDGRMAALEAGADAVLTTIADEEIKQAYRPYDWKNGRMHLPMDEWEHLLQKIQEKGYSYT